MKTIQKRPLRLALAQMNPVVGDYEGNFRKIAAWIQLAGREGADLIVFPEMALSGYPIWDLANHPGFVRESHRYLQKICRLSRGLSLGIVLGFIDRSSSEPRRSRNALALIERGRIRAVYHKRLLPTYDVFLEALYFEPGQGPVVVPFRGYRLGFTVCEDTWDQGYAEKPVKDLIRKGADFLINISASPYYAGVASKREAVMRRHARRYGVPLLYVNQVGAQDDLIFDGRSFLLSPQGRTLFRARAFEEGIEYVDYWGSRSPQAGAALPEEETPAEKYEALKMGLRDYCRKNGFQKVILGLSGGIDSALTAALAADALGPEAVKGITMPSRYSSKGSWEDSRELARRLGIEFEVLPIQTAYTQLLKDFRKSGGVPSGPGITLAMENLQARIRGLVLMYYSNHENRLLLSTGNKSELAMGYCTLYGDMCGGLAVLGDVYKTEVYRLSRYRNSLGEVIPRSILEKAPSAELRPDQKDQDSLPPYEVLDAILHLFIEKQTPAAGIVRILKPKKVSAGLIEKVLRQVNHNEYKRRQTPPILRVTEKAWFGRRMPITNRYRD